MKTTFVLSGGSTKGCFQAGAIKEVLAHGIIPDHIYGISVGSLNGGWLANHVGEIAAGGVVTSDDWKNAGPGLCSFWKEKIKTGKDVAVKRGTLCLIWQLITKTFKGIYNTSPIINLTRSILKEANLKKAPVTFKVGTVNINGTLKAEYVSVNDGDFDYFMNMLIGSISMPIVMPPAMVKGMPYYDGGMRDVAPLGEAINDQEPEKPDLIVCMLCQTRNLTGKAISTGSLLDLSQRTIDIMTNETVNNDIDFTNKINELVGLVGADFPEVKAKYKQIQIIVIRPDDTEPLEIDLDNVTEQKIAAAIAYGERKAKEVLSLAGL